MYIRKLFALRTMRANVVVTGKEALASTRLGSSRHHLSYVHTQQHNCQRNNTEHDARPTSQSA